MALLFCDGFDHYSQAGMYGKWDAIVQSGSVSTPQAVTSLAINAAAGRFGGQGLNINQQNQNYFQKSIGKNVVTGILGFAVNINFATGSANQPLVFASFLDGNTVQVSVQVTPAGFLQASRGSGLTVLGTSTVILPMNSWHYIEFLATIDPSAGVIGVKLDGVQVLSLTSQNTRASANSQWNSLQLGAVNSPNGGGLFIDDVYVCDATGSFNNTYLGDVRVQSVLPNANGTENDFTRGGPTQGTQNYQEVNEFPQDDDTSFVSSQTIGNIDRYLYPAIAPAAGSCAAVVVWNRARKDDAGVRSVRAAVKSGATVSDSGTDIPLTANYTYLGGVFETDPNTSAQWTYANIAVAEFGVKVTA